MSDYIFKAPSLFSSYQRKNIVISNRNQLNIIKKQNSEVNKVCITDENSKNFLSDEIEEQKALDNTSFKFLLKKYEIKARNVLNIKPKEADTRNLLPIQNHSKPKAKSVLPKIKTTLIQQPLIPPINKLGKYKIGKDIGKGAYANVKIVTLKSTNTKYAMKIYEKYKLLDKSKKKRVMQEIQIMKKIYHKNIVKLYEILLIMEYINGRSLRDYYTLCKRKIEEQKCKSIFYQILNAMDYLHKNHIAHRDIKLENILLDDKLNVKLIDFGFSIYDPNDTMQNFFCGTPNYMPPEIILKNNYNGYHADLWSLGVLLFKMLTGEFPFKGKEEKDLYNVIKKGIFSFPPTVSIEAQDVIGHLILLNPSIRSSCEDVMGFEWFEDCNTN